MTNWNSRYLPPDPNLWQGRADTPPQSCFFQTIELINLLEIKNLKLNTPAFAFVGFRCDEGVRRNCGRIGAIEGPAAIRQALAKLPVQSKNFKIYDMGNIMCPDHDLEASQAALSELISILISYGVVPILLGGGHEISWGHYQGISQIYPEEDLGIINFDAHFDMRPLINEEYGSSGTSFLQIALDYQARKKRFDYNCIGIQHAANIRLLTETAKKFNTQIIWADELHMGLLEKTTDFIDRVIDENDMIYLSLDLDVFSAAYAPGVSAPQPLGLLPWHIIPLLRQLSASGKVISFDIAELSPRYDIDHRTAKLAANLIYEFIHHYNTQPPPWS